jgi:acetylornithine deacetylase/succinyl-diaminopimelate desuccinylase-like protein
MAHQDVVPVAPGTERDWSVEPFSGQVKDGYVCGRGAWDDRGNLMAQMEAMEMLVASGYKPERTVYIAFGADEEAGGSRGAARIAALLKERQVRLGFVIDEGLLITDGIIKGLTQPAALIGVAEKGYLSVVLKVSATPGHASMPPPQGTSAIASAGNKENVLPGKAEATINYRLLPGDTKEQVLERARSQVAQAIGRDQFELIALPGAVDASKVTPADSAQYRLLNRTIRQVFPNVLVAPGLMIGATDFIHFGDISDHIFKFSPARAKTEDLPRFHGTNERISIANYAEAIRFYFQLMTEGAKV